jgi:hypothetical protein
MAGRNEAVLAKMQEAMARMREARKLLPRDPRNQTQPEAKVAWYLENGITRLKHASEAWDEPRADSEE